LSSVFSCVFVSVSGTYFKCFICLLFYVASIIFVCFKNRSDITRGINVKIEREREWSPRGRTAQVWAAQGPRGRKTRAKAGDA
jgi:hypothetical protein